TNNESVLVQSTAGIAEATDSSIRLYPNPAISAINITANQNLQKISIMDSAGRHISTVVFTSGAINQQLDISHLNAGIYFVKIKSKQGVNMLKFVKE
ncbi:MAG: T9SS type A sorting domain-containing protein, partial [Nonlabens sp.]|nr:T9SS type A sorting domain-containing protein [Nonlabens sp.]